MDRFIKIWDINKFICLNSLIGHLNTVWTLAYLENEEFIASGGSEHIIKIWDLKTYK
jgi:WD40 repeat protein